MTCIAAIAHDGNVFMAGDRMAADAWHMQTHSPCKIFHRENMIFGYTTSFRIGQIIQYKMVIPKNKHEDTMEYLVSSFVEELRKSLKEGGITEIKNNQESGGEILVGYKGSIYHIQGEFSVLKCDEGYGSVGGGAHYALGSFATTEIIKTSESFPKGQIGARLRLELAMKAAEKHSMGVCGPFDYINLNPITRTD